MKLWRVGEDWGTVEGELRAVRLAGERVYFAITDPVTGCTTECRIPPRLAGETRPAEGMRVAVSGPIHYGPDGEALSIDVREFHVFPPDSDLPRVADV